MTALEHYQAQLARNRDDRIAEARLKVQFAADPLDEACKWILQLEDTLAGVIQQKYVTEADFRASGVE